jgi:flagellar hook-basal body complex protein FliE
MSEMNISNVLSAPFAEKPAAKPVAKDPASDFKASLRESVDEMNRLLKEADEATNEMVGGKKDVHEAMIAIEQANLSLRMMIQVRNKVVSAYEEIMRMAF